MKKRPVGFTVLSFIGAYIILQNALWLLLCPAFPQDEDPINIILRFLSIAVTSVLVYGLWYAKKWTLKVFLVFAPVSIINMIAAASPWFPDAKAILFVFIPVVLWCSFVLFFVGRYIRSRLKDVYSLKNLPSESDSKDI